MSSDKFRNQFRISSTRLKNWDYGAFAAYFITICTQHRELFFGDVCEGKMNISTIGKIVEDEWLKTPLLRPDMNLYLEEFVVMPNHFHGIIIIGENEYNIGSTDNIGSVRGSSRDAMHGVSTNAPQFNFANHFGPQSKNLPSIIRGFKSAVTIHARKFNANFSWQSRYYDHIIRNDISFTTISSYIKNNPKNWLEDKFYHNSL